MSVHTIEIPGLSDETLRLLDDRVRKSGSDRAEYIRHLLDRDLHSPNLSELLGPFRKQVAESEISEDDLDQLLNEARDEVFEAKTAQRK